MELLKPNRQNANVAIAILLIILLIKLLLIYSFYLNFELAMSMISGNEITFEIVNTYNTRVEMLENLEVGAYIISVFTFLTWFRTAYSNLHILYDDLSYSKGWAIGCWFVPFINITRPLKIVKELFEKASDYLYINTENNKKYNEVLINLWWVIWVSGFSLNQVLSNFIGDPQTLEGLKGISKLSMFLNFYGIVSILITVKMIRDYSNLELLLDETQYEEEVEEDENDFEKDEE